MCFVFLDNEDDILNLALVQYHFSEGVHQLKTAPHGNARSHQPYIRTMPSVMCKLKEQAKKQTPKRVLQFVSSEAGGILEASSSGALPRCRQQIKDAKRNYASKQVFDPSILCHAHV